MTIRDALRSGNMTEALNQLLATWSLTRSSRIATAIDRVSMHAGRETAIEIASVPPEERDALWIKIASRHESKDLGPLLDKWSAEPASMSERFVHLEQFPEDPRLAMALTRLIVERLDREVLINERFCDYLIVLSDPRTVASLHLARDRYQKLQIPLILKTTIERLAVQMARVSRATVSAGWIDEVFEHLPPPAVLPDAPIHRAPPPAIPIERRAWDLVQAVYNDPDDDELRQVCGDALSEMGDARGEFIALSFRVASGKARNADRKRHSDLLKENGAKWMGDLAKRIQLDHARFEKGFLSFLHFHSIPLGWWKEVCDAPELATVTQLRISGVDAAMFAAVASTAALHRVREIRFLSDAYYGFRLSRDLPTMTPTFGKNVTTCGSWTSYLYGDDIRAMRAAFPNTRHLIVGWPAQFFGLQPTDPDDVKELLMRLDGIEEVTLEAAARLPGFALNVLSQLESMPASIRCVHLNVGPEGWLLQRTESSHWSTKIVALSGQFDPARIRAALRELPETALVIRPTELPTVERAASPRPKSKRGR